jgi:predicted ester cyclase
MFGIKGSGQPISFTGMNIMTVRDGKIVEAWVERDAFGLARQIGLIKE